MRNETPADGATSISLLKELARKHKRSAGCSHHDALESVAQRYGFDSWKALLVARLTVLRPADTAVRSIERSQRSLEREPSTIFHLQRTQFAAMLADRYAVSTPLVQVQTIPIAESMRLNVMHRLRIADRTWHLFRRRDWLYLQLEESTRRAYDGASTYCGDCTRVTYLPGLSGGRQADRAEGWYVVKYHTERCIPLHGIGIDALVEVAYQYGIGLDNDMHEGRQRFFESPAFATVRSVMADLPRGPRNRRGSGHANPYLGEWMKVVRGESVDATFEPWELVA